jgi:hypothetical protein
MAQERSSEYPDTVYGQMRSQIAVIEAERARIQAWTKNTPLWRRVRMVGFPSDAQESIATAEDRLELLEHELREAIVHQEGDFPLSFLTYYADESPYRHRRFCYGYKWQRDDEVLYPTFYSEWLNVQHSDDRCASLKISKNSQGETIPLVCLPKGSFMLIEKKLGPEHNLPDGNYAAFWAPKTETRPTLVKPGSRVLSTLLRNRYPVEQILVGDDTVVADSTYPPDIGLFTVIIDEFHHQPIKGLQPQFLKMRSRRHIAQDPMFNNNTRETV